MNRKTAVLNSKILAKILLSLGFTSCLAIAGSWFSQPAQAQISDDPQTREIYPTNEINGLTGGSFSPFDFIHRANFGTRRDASTFRQDSLRSMDDASAIFRARQLELMLNNNTNNNSVVPETIEVPTEEKID